MNQEKYIGMDVHQATISVAVIDSSGKLIMECILETKAATMLEFLQELRGSLSVAFEEGTSAAWLHDLLKPHVAHLVVYDPRKAALLKDGSKSDRIFAVEYCSAWAVWRFRQGNNIASDCAATPLSDGSTCWVAMRAVRRGSTAGLCQERTAHSCFAPSAIIEQATPRASIVCVHMRLKISR
jgi:hypothetical protein